MFQKHTVERENKLMIYLHVSRIKTIWKILNRHKTFKTYVFAWMSSFILCNLSLKAQLLLQIFAVDAVAHRCSKYAFMTKKKKKTLPLQLGVCVESRCNIVRASRAKWVIRIKWVRRYKSWKEDYFSCFVILTWLRRLATFWKEISYAPFLINAKSKRGYSIISAHSESRKNRHMLWCMIVMQKGTRWRTLSNSRFEICQSSFMSYRVLNTRILFVVSFAQSFERIWKE